ncbi:hypothetical protein TUBRATIS_23900 [Tubulinosema ratisbonensis]|uniref:Uncharacterized protein n=1 Tax=Tubulinosema ratisbonensis TaxID=291195 RepID=A0A437AJ35_9MICR|nr:hypothetical protein TUBRATIS_23900 [Tubulinosema ratisbonensis]
MFKPEARNQNFSKATFIKCFIRSFFLKPVTQLENFRTNNLVLPLLLVYAFLFNLLQFIDLLNIKDKSFTHKLKSFVLNLGVNVIIMVIFTISISLIAKFLYKKYDFFYIFRIILYSSVLGVIVFLISRSSFLSDNYYFNYKLFTNILCVILCVILFIRNMNSADK